MVNSYSMNTADQDGSSWVFQESSSYGSKIVVELLPSYPLNHKLRSREQWLSFSTPIKIQTQWFWYGHVADLEPELMIMEMNYIELVPGSVATPRVHY